MTIFANPPQRLHPCRQLLVTIILAITLKHYKRSRENKKIITPKKRKGKQMKAKKIASVLMLIGMFAVVALLSSCEKDVDQPVVVPTC